MSLPTPAKAASKGVRTTTVFTSGNSQAVRLPKDFRLESKTVEIFWRGDEIVLRAKPQSLGKKLGDLLAGMPPLSEAEASQWEEVLAASREDRLPQERDFSWMQDAKPTADKKPKSRSL